MGRGGNGEGREREGGKGRRRVRGGGRRRVMGLLTCIYVGKGENTEGIILSTPAPAPPPFLYLHLFHFPLIIKHSPFRNNGSVPCMN